MLNMLREEKSESREIGGERRLISQFWHIALYMGE